MSDLINREDAINKLYNINPSEDFLFIDAIVDMLENLPSEELKAQKPEITAKVKQGWGFAMCEFCKKRVFPNDIYCSHCGAKLEWE